MIIFGVLLLLGGAGCFYYGDQLNSNVEAQLRSIFSKGQGNPGTVFIIIGIVMAILGVILIIAGIVRKAANSRESSPGGNSAPPVQTPPQYLIKVKCPNCNTLNDQDTAFCTQCGYTFTKPRSQENPSFWKCGCGKNNSPDDLFCGTCGQKKPM